MFFAVSFSTACKSFGEKRLFVNKYSILITTLFLLLLIVLPAIHVFAQNNSAAQVENAINMLKSSGTPVDDATLAQMYTSAAQLHLNDGNHQQATARIKLALQMCRDQKLDAATPYALMIASTVMKKMDSGDAAEFLKRQLNHPNASPAYKKEVLKTLGQQLATSGDLVLSIQMSKAALDAVQKESPGSVEEAEALLVYGQQCLTAKLFDLGLAPLKRAKELGANLDRSDLSDRAAYQFAVGLLTINKDTEARKVLEQQITSIRKSGNLLMLPTMQMTLARVQIKLEDFDAATRTIEDLARESAASDGNYTSYALSLKATNLFAASVAKLETEKTLPAVIKNLESAIAARTKMLAGAGQSLADVANASDYLSLAAFQAIEGNNEAADKTLDQTRTAINAMEAQYQKAVKAGVMNSDETSVIIADQRAAIAEIRQQLLVRNAQFDEALVVAERSRGEAQSELLRRRLGIDQKADNAEPISIAKIQAIADSQKTTLVYYSLVHALNPAIRGFFDSDHTVNAPHSLYIWVVRPQQDIEFCSQILPVRINELIARGREEIFAFMNEANANQAVEDQESSLATDADVVRMLNRSTERPPEDFDGSHNAGALDQLHRLLVGPIKKWLPKSPEEIITVVPQGKLFVVPFAALQDADGEPLIAQHTLSISPSARMLALADQQFRSVKQKNTRVLIVGNPTMPRYQSRPDKESVPLQPLPGAESEANYIAELFKVTPLKGDEADERSVVAAMKTAKYIHLATHGLLEAENTYAQSYLSSLALAPSAGEDGFLTVRETMQLDLNAELAVLSGCDTGRGRITGDGVVGLARGYISAGVPTVVVSLWPVSDNSTALLMAMYYSELLSGEAKAAALRNAMLKTRQQFTQPHAWAAFTLYGYSR